MAKFHALLLSAASLIAAAASAQDVPNIRIPAAPVSPAALVVPVAPGTKAVPMLVEVIPGAVACDGQSVTPVAIEPPFPLSSFANPGDTRPIAPIDVSFAIDAGGRPISIVHEPVSGIERRTFYPQSADVLPSLAVSRFPVGRPRASCRVSYTPRTVAVADAPMPLVQRYLVAPHTRQSFDLDLFRRMHPADTNCIEAGTPKVRMRAYPAFEDIPQSPGTWSFAMTRFDIDAKGQPVNVRIIGSDGNAALDRASIAAVRQSRFAPEARKGCTYPYYRRNAQPLAAPPMPDKASFVPDNARCREEDTKWTSKLDLRFPAGFERRGIEGWAVISYDVAPWGQTGNVKILAAQPASAFGTQALNIIATARQAPLETGRTGCVDIVRFVISSGNAETAAQPPIMD